MKTRYSTTVQEQPNEAPQKPAEDHVFEFTDPIVLIKKVAHVTAPDFSLVFIAGFLLLTFVHEQYFAETAIFLLGWIAVQLVVFTTNDDFKNDLFWNIVSLIGHLVFYLFLGYCWSMLKLYLDIWQGHLDPALLDRIRKCIASEQNVSCVVPLLLDMKFMIVRHMTTWPISLFYTLTRDPLRIFTDLLYYWSRQRWVAIMSIAIQAHDLQNSTDVAASASWQTLAIWMAYILGYIIIGYGWTHVKLFVDVWQGALPPSLDQQVRSVWERKDSYWDFVKQIKWLVAQWMVTWPISVVYTVLRHPLKILVDFVYQLSQRKFVWIVGKAMEARMKKD